MADPRTSELVIGGARLLGGAAETAGRPVDVVVLGGKVAAIAPAGVRRPPGARVLDADDCTVGAGFVDLQCNGAVGVDLTREPERLWEVAAALPRWGVTGWLPTLISAPPDVVGRAVDTLTRGPSDLGPHAEPLGLHLEGPALNPARRGAHPAAALRSAAEVASQGWSRRAGVAMVTLAPELPGALHLVSALAARGVVVSLGHTDASAAQAAAAVERGASVVTHLFNAMAPLGHREPGVVGRALVDPRLAVGLIADGVHVDPLVVDLCWRAVGPRLVLVSDAVAALGAPAGPSRIAAEVEVRSDASSVRLEDGTLAGSVLSMDAAVRNLDRWTGCGRAAAAHAATTAPAGVLGLTDRGRVAVGAVADLVVADRAGHVVASITRGEVALGQERVTDPAGRPA